MLLIPKIVYIAPAAPNVWPRLLFKAEINGILPVLPKTYFIALASISSPA